MNQSKVVSEVLSADQHPRLQSDRREKYFKSFLYSFFMRRRKNQRRQADQVANTFVDTHELRLAVVFIITLFFCIADALLTLYIIEKGGEEINPFMQFLMDKDVMLFFWAKFAITSFGMLFLISHKHFTFCRVINGYHMLYAIAAMYMILVNYEVIIITQYILSH